ncbi:MAG: thiol oxidoreductase [Burkholderiaceae bacterium]|nr:thiol oxidoreductase [Burkholderiaceae bacterium]
MTLPGTARARMAVTAAVAFAALALPFAVETQVLRSAPKPVRPDEVYLQPVPGLTHQQLQKFKAGEKQFRAPWVVFPLLGGEWGLGPTFLATSCVGCHVQGGRGRTFDEPGAIVFQQLLRLSVPGEGADGGPKPHPDYGDQLQVFGVNVGLKENLKPGEAELYVDWITQTVTLRDGTVVELRKPSVRIEKPNFGPIDEKVMTSLRNTQVVFGMGYLEAVSEQDILQLAELQKAQGLNGRPNYVRDDIGQRTALGRFGWKANQPSIRQQIVAAFHGDMGVTSSLYIEENCPPAQEACRAMPPGNRPELLDYAWDDLAFWSVALDAPPQRNQDSPAVRRGEQLFAAATCAHCHVPELKTGSFPLLPQLSGKRFRAYTDMLLHDMGEGLADGRPDFKAGPRDWRTAPLWGIGVSRQVNGSVSLLHDGRARNVVEAILWHGGEAQRARDAFAAMSREERDALVEFVNSL